MMVDFFEYEDEYDDEDDDLRSAYRARPRPRLFSDFTFLYQVRTYLNRSKNQMPVASRHLPVARG
jgi:hypothetical protein